MNLPVAFLEGISPWWWVAAAILLAAIEMLTVSTVMIWSAAAAMVVAILLWVAPGLPGAVQVAVFGALSIAFTFAGRAAVARYGDGDRQASTLNRRADRLVGREGVVIAFAGGEGRVTIDGEPWPARLDGAEPAPVPGDRVRVVAADGMVVWVAPGAADPARR